MISISFWSIGQEGVYQDAPNWSSENLKGEVKFIEEKSFNGIEQNGEYVAKSPGWQYTWERDTKSFYDSLGNLIKVDFYSSGKIERSEIFKYENLKLIESIRLFHHRIFEYDDLGRIKIEYYKNQQPETIKSGNESPVNKSTFSKIEYFYDNSGNLILKKETEPSNSSQSIDSIFYDAQNRPIKILSYYNDIIDFQVLNYDSNGNILQLATGDSEDGLMEKTIYSYENNQLTIEEWELYTDNQPDGKVIYYYEGGNEVKTVETESDGSVTNTTDTTYEFDQKGNWIKKTMIDSDDGNIYIVTRKIEYY